MDQTSATSAGPWRTFGLTGIAVFLVSLDATIGFAAFPALRDSFPAASAAYISWVLNAYTIVYAALLVPAGRLADLLGRKRLFLAGVSLFTAASALCGLAPNVETLIGFRILQAVGAALLTPTSLALILQAFPVHKRAIAVSLWGALGALAAALGPSAGAAIIEAADWRWAFYVNVPFGVYAAVRAARLLAESSNPEQGAALDVPGVLLVIASVSLVTLGIVQSDAWGWASAATAWTVGGGIALALAFVRWAWKRPGAAIDLSLFRDTTYRFANLGTLTFSIAFTAMFLSYFVFLRGVWHYSLSLAGLAITPGPLMVIPVAVVCGRLAGRVGHRPFLVLGGLLYAAAGAWLYFRIGAEPQFLAVWLPGLLIGGAGVGMVLPSLAGAAVAKLPAARFGIGSAVNMAVRQLGATLGVAFAVSLLASAPGVAGFHHINLLLIAGGLATALLSLPVATAPARAVAATPTTA
ncbi:MFS transporter [Ramlibacter sp.]|uniref:MFS transporter n=1 Tax=Ramlibacter sp. TaxID=1917967 RepID=UPI0025E6ABB4|nr:MFS transporter [Ramlibacter sp.]